MKKHRRGDRAEMRPELNQTISREHGNHGRADTGEDKTPAGPPQARPDDRHDRNHESNMDDSQTAETQQIPGRAQTGIHQPGTRRRRAERGKEQRIVCQPGTLTEITLTEREMPPDVVGPDRLSNGEQDEPTPHGGHAVGDEMQRERDFRKRRLRHFVGHEALHLREAITSVARRSRSLEATSDRLRSLRDHLPASSYSHARSLRTSAPAYRRHRA